MWYTLYKDMANCILHVRNKQPCNYEHSNIFKIEDLSNNINTQLTDSLKFLFQ